MKFFKSKVLKNIYKVITTCAILNKFHINFAYAEDITNTKSDCDYLKKIFNELNLNSTWKDNTNSCCNSINGVTCNPSSRIINLKFDKMAIYGQLSDEIGQLTELKSLKFDNNKIYGSIPVNIGKLTNLEELYLNNNNISGEIPKEIESLEKLKTLNLGNNGIYNYIPEEIGSLKSLQSLWIENNNLSGAIPTSLSYLKNLKDINLSGNSNLQGALPSMEFITTCDYSKTGLCIPKSMNNVKCKSLLVVCSDEEEKNTEILRNRQKIKEMNEEEQQENNTNITNSSKFFYGHDKFIILLLIIFFVIVIILIIVLEKYIKYKYINLQKNMSRRQYFINHSIRNENNDSNNTNETDDIQITNNRYELEMAASQLSNNTRISQDNYQPIYPDNLQVDQPGISSTNSQVVQAYISPQIIQVPALAHSPQTRSVISGPYINNGDYVVVDQGSNTDNLINYNPNHSSLILTNGNSLHATRSLANRHRKYSGGGHSPVITGVTSYNSSRYSVNGSIYNTVNNRHSIGVYSIANSIITNHSGNTFNYGIRDEVGNSQSHSERNRHEDDSNDFITTNTSTSHNHNHNNNNNNSNNNTNDNTNNDSNEYNNLRSKVPSPLNLDSSSHYSNENKINSFNSNTNSSPLLSSKNLNDSNDFIISADVLDESTCINEDKIHRYNEHEIDDHIMASAIKNGDIHSKIGKNKMSDTEEGSSISMSLSISSKKLNYDSNNENENEGVMMIIIEIMIKVIMIIIEIMILVRRRIIIEIIIEIMI
ncbi:hypothetical protein H8356DRAFT_1049598 [Neocallimastix lanati (nom. inval.)]|nr:hypothetical protein H8356DRAFT_1049598 [Neocallimastix sp. JGI-2020a]